MNQIIQILLEGESWTLNDFKFFWHIRILKYICLIVSSYQRQNEYRGGFILPKVKIILFRYNML